MLAPNPISAFRLSKEVGVSQSQLSRWLRVAPTLSLVSKKSKEHAEHGEARTTSRTPEEKVRIVMSAAALKSDELGEFLRREGVHEAELEQWRTAVVDAAKSAFDGGPTRSPGRGTEAKRIKEHERELRRKDKALAETAALLVLQKKVREIWGDADDDTDEGNGK